MKKSFIKKLKKYAVKIIFFMKPAWYTMKKFFFCICILFAKSSKLQPSKKINTLLIVSLTSYGTRVKSSTPYAVYSLMRQKVLPNKIVLWLDNDNWNKQNIPFLLKKLERLGLEIRFCEDLKSYKKLIPALMEFPNDTIITADDDVYYAQDWLKLLIHEHEKKPQKIICHRARRIEMDDNHNPLSYEKWNFFSHKNYCHYEEYVFPTSGGGVLYPPHSLHKDVMKKKLFLKLSPMADDIWYWAMAIINKEYFGINAPFVVVPNGYNGHLHAVETPHPTALYFNNSKGGNDTQFKAVLDYYPQIYHTLKNNRIPTSLNNA